MLSLTIKCHCAKSKKFAAENVKGIIKQIDGSGWKDRGYLCDEGLPALPKGQTYGACPDHCDDFNDPRLGETLGTPREDSAW